MSGFPVDGRLRWLRVSGAEASLLAALVYNSLWAEDFQDTEDEPVCKKLCRHLPVCALLLVHLELQCFEKLGASLKQAESGGTLAVIVVYQIALYAAFYSAWFQTGSHTKAQENVAQCLRVTGAGVCARHAAACVQFLVGLSALGPEGGAWPMLKTRRLCATRWPF